MSIDTGPGWLRLVVGTLIGYVIAVAVAATIAVLVLAISQTTGSGSAISTLRQLPSIWGVGVAITALTAWPWYLVTIGVAYWKKWDSWLFFAVCGVATACLAIWTFEGPARLVSLHAMLNFLGEMYYALPGGFFGGLAYACFRRRYFNGPPAPSVS